MSESFAAVDLGATSGRVIVGEVIEGHVHLRPIRRFPNNSIHTPGGLRWNLPELYNNIIDGVKEAARQSDLISVGVDSWGVDYGLVRAGELIELPFHYRDRRGVAAADRVLDRIDAPSLYARTGIQHAAINTISQLHDDKIHGRLEASDHLLLIPDLIGYWLTGTLSAERTIASTTGLLQAESREWDLGLLDLLEYPRTLFPPLIDAGSTIAGVHPHLGMAKTTVTAVGAHDTASAVVGVPSSRDDFVYISCGTWGIVGTEVEHPNLSEAARLAGFTNEGGVDGRIRLQRNAMGLWLLSESLRAWEEEGGSVDLTRLLEAAADVPPPHSIVDVDDAVFASPGDMPERMRSWMSERGMAVPQRAAALTRCIVESLAQNFAEAAIHLDELSGRQAAVIHLVGGGSLNELLCQAVANRSGKTVLAGPVEATAMGNVLVQARTTGTISGSIEALRSKSATASPPRAYHPRSDAPA